MLGSSGVAQLEPGFNRGVLRDNPREARGPWILPEFTAFMSQMMCSADMSIFLGHGQ